MKLIKLSLLLPLLFFIIENFCYAQSIENTTKEKHLFNEWDVNFSFVNLGIINHWHLPLNFDSRRPYMHYSIGIQSNLTKTVSLRLDYFSNYNNLFFKNFFNPSIITLSPRWTFNKISNINPFIDFKFGLAIVESEEYYMLSLVSNPPFVIGIRTGINTQITKNFTLGFSFDNLGILYKYNSTVYPLENGRDESRISMLTTDFIYRFKH